MLILRILIEDINFENVDSKTNILNIIKKMKNRINIYNYLKWSQNQILKTQLHTLHPSSKSTGRQSAIFKGRFGKSAPLQSPCPSATNT